MSTLTKLFVLVLLVLVFTFAIQNRSAVDTVFFYWEAKVPRLISTLLILCAGICIGMVLRSKPRSIFK